MKVNRKKEVSGCLKTRICIELSSYLDFFFFPLTQSAIARIRITNTPSIAMATTGHMYVGILEKTSPAAPVEVSEGCTSTATEICIADVTIAHYVTKLNIP